MSPKFYGQVGTRCYVPTAIGDNLQYQFQSGHDIYAPTGGIATLYFCEANFWVSPASTPAYLDSATGGTLTASMGVEYPAGSGTYYRPTWPGGAASTVIGDKSVAWAKLSLALPAGKSRINLIRRLQNSNVIALNRQANGARRYLTGGDVAETSTVDKTLTGGLVDNGGDFMIWPAAIVALTDQVSCLFNGDSRTIGERDATPTNEHQGQLAHSLGPLFPYINMGVAGQPYVDFSQNPLRAALAKYCTTFLDANGYNSRVLSAAAMYAAAHAEANFFSPREAWFATIYPGATSTNGFIDTAHQTTDGFNANRTGANDLFRADPRCLEIADLLESSRNSGLWLPHNPGYTDADDGVHANSSGVVLVDLSSAFSPTLTNPTSFMPMIAPTDSPAGPVTPTPFFQLGVNF